MLAKHIILRDTTVRGQRVGEKEEYGTQTEKMPKVLKSF